MKLQKQIQLLAKNYNQFRRPILQKIKNKQTINSFSKLATETLWVNLTKKHL